jgi:hypothetical protein
MEIFIEFFEKKSSINMDTLALIRSLDLTHFCWLVKTEIRQFPPSCQIARKRNQFFLLGSGSGGRGG